MWQCDWGGFGCGARFTSSVGLSNHRRSHEYHSSVRAAEGAAAAAGAGASSKGSSKSKVKTKSVESEEDDDEKGAGGRESKMVAARVIELQRQLQAALADKNAAVSEQKRTQVII